MKSVLKFFSVIAVVSGLLAGCAPAPTPIPATETPVPPTETSVPTPGPFTLTSDSFKEGEELADKFTYTYQSQCNGENISPALEWQNAPDGTKSFVIVNVDPDGQNWVHWVQYNIPANVTEFPETVGGPDIGIKAKNGFYQDGYSGPCPPGGVHHYVFTIYALDTMLSLQGTISLRHVEAGMKGHILAQATLTGLRTKK